MAETIANNIPINVNPAPVRKERTKKRKALKPKTPSGNEANILAGNISQIPLPDLSGIGKENNETLISAKKTTKRNSKSKELEKSFEKELQELQGKFEELRVEKEKADELVKVRDEMLKQKEEEIEAHGKEQEKLHLELKKLQKLKEFKPTMDLPLIQSLGEKDQQKKVKNKKGCPETKRPSPPYILFCKDQWNEVKKENLDAEFKEVTNIVGEKWRNLSAEEKKPYEEKYQDEREAYLQIVAKEKRESEAMKLLEEDQKQKTAMELLEQYLQFKQEADQQTKKKKKTKKQKDPLKPKRPISAFFLFSKDLREALSAENKNMLEIAKIAGEKWKNMLEEQRLPYEEVAKKQKEEYLLEIEVYKTKQDNEAVTRQLEEEQHLKIQKQEALQLLRKKEKAENIIKKTKENRQKKMKQKEEKNTDPNKPKKPASSFILFRKETRMNLQQEVPGINNSRVNAIISVKWKELDDAERKLWTNKATEAMVVYKKELEEYKADAAKKNNPQP
ncbi:hypothetical protein GIB67_006374 [Kingdonia uniflora]|uniref:HMG box domain-containing protein n=1 Tax=Kingdonia uniflora TaxID=39325 RepID=A0A7J7P1E6_9MAGN|nr:hypothetical protein GIB67_006374 [Kingdonia uniflora]